MALEQSNSEAICWAEYATAPGARNRAAFKWENGVRVPSVDSKTGAQLVERLPLQAHRGSKLTGVVVANDIKSTMKVLRHDGILADVKISNGPAHEVDDADRYAMTIKRKGRALGWIPMGECPAAMAAYGAVPAHTLLADAARDGQACAPHTLGIRNPPCRHFLAEQKARVAAAEARQKAREEGVLTEEAKMNASNAATVKSSLESTTALLAAQGETNAVIAQALAALTAKAEPPAKASK